MGKRKLLFIDHSCHKLTHSAEFFLLLLRNEFDVDEFYYDRHYCCNPPEALVATADLIVIWEFLPRRFHMGFPGKPCVFVPMYDNEWGSKWLWRRLARSGMKVISFCGRITAHALSCGMMRDDILDVRYAIDPGLFDDMAGDVRTVALWERGDVSFDDVKAVLDPGDVDKVIIYRRKEETVSRRPILAEDVAAYKVELRTGGFLSREEYLESQREAGICFAPRRKEGIGMAFLEHLAMGKCVIAHDDATMNEYIHNGTNGVLVDMGNPVKVSSSTCLAARMRVRDEARRQFARWEEDRNKILPFLDAAARAGTLRSQWNPRAILWFCNYLVEGAWFKWRKIIAKCGC